MFFSFGNGFGFQRQRKSGGGGGYEDLLPALSFGLSSYDYGSHDTGTNTDYIFTLTNSGNEVAEGITVAVSGTGYSLITSAGPFDIEDGEYATITVRFTPTGAGESAGALTVSWPNQDNIVVMLSGEGVATGCSSGTFIGGIDLSAESTLGTSAINSAQQYGQSFKLPDSAGIYSVLFGVNSPVTTSGDFEIRICATADCTSYLATTGIIEISVAGWQEFVLTTHPVLMSDTTYYIAIAPVSTGSIDIKRLTNDYVDGARGYHIGAGFGTLTMTTGDLQFGVKICA